MAMLSGRSGGGYSYSTTQTIHLSISDAIQRVLSGSMTATELYSKAPSDFKKVLDEFSGKTHDNSFLYLDNSEQSCVLRGLLDAMSGR